VWFAIPYKNKATGQRFVKPAVITMNAKLKVLLFTVTLLASVVTECGSFTSASRRVGGKRSIKQLYYSEESNGRRKYRQDQEDSDVVCVRKDQLCELAKETC